MCFLVICLIGLKSLIYLIKISDNIDLIKFVATRKRIFRYFPLSVDNFLHYLALCGTSYGTAGDQEILKQLCKVSALKQFVHCSFDLSE